MGEIVDILNNDEAILWQGRPALLPFFASSLLSALIGIPPLLWALRSVATNPLGPGSRIFTLFFLAPFFLVGLSLAVAYPLYHLLVYVNLSYGITNKRVLLQSGIIEKDALMLDFDQISNA
jgi:uncharacterized membrane protein YdbT with pleckstrin-like domain